ncbi:MAG: hypothetical protein LBP58_09910 [Azoarcus sp.]|jgi:hypothetical protein|nr:hypothetical protein [Azoarcus sp.]
MLKEYINSIYCAVAIFVLFLTAILGLIGIGERFCAVLYNAWKFYGFADDPGIPLSASAVFFGIGYSIFGLLICLIGTFTLKKAGRKWESQIAVAGCILYFINLFLLSFMIIGGLAFIYYEH